MEEECFVTHETWVTAIRLHSVTFWEMLSPTAGAFNYYLLTFCAVINFLWATHFTCRKEKICTNKAAHEGKRQNCNKIRQMYASSHHN